MLLCIDVGNTNITIGVYDGKSLGARWRVATNHERMPDEYGIQLLALLSNSGIVPTDLSDAAIASVVPTLTQHLVQVCELIYKRRNILISG